MDWWQTLVGDAKLYYYPGMNGARWRLEGTDYSFWAANDDKSVADLANSIEGLEEANTDSPCGPIPSIEGWWTTNRRPGC